MLFKTRDPIDDAITAAQKACAVLQSLHGKVAAIDAEFESVVGLESDLALQALETGADPQVSDRATRLSVERGTFERARPSATRKAVEAVRAIYLAGSQAAEEKAADLRAEATTIADATRPLLAKLSELEGIELDRSILQHQRAGDWYSTRVMGGRFANEDDGPGARPDPTNNSPFAIPRSVKARWQAELHDRRALELQGKAEAVSAGAGNAEELLQAAVAAVRPTPEQVEEAA